VARFHQTINYSSCNEDWRSEAKALQISSKDRVLCITGSGDRPLHLLLTNPHKVISLDANPLQNHLLEFKKAALEKFAYSDYIALLGLTKSKSRLKDAISLYPNLSAEASSYWKDKKKIVHKGVLYSGRFEKFYHKVSISARLFRYLTIRKLFSFQNINEQKQFIDQTWNRRWWRSIYILLCSKFFLKTFLRDPAFYRYVNLKESAGNYIYSSMLHILKTTPARENFMLSLLLNGKLSGFDLPPYLKEVESNTIKKNLSKLEIVTANIVAYLRSCPDNSFTRFSLSDVPSYLNEREFFDLLSEVIRTAKHGARICIRLFLVHYEIPDKFMNTIIRETDLEDELARTDRSFVYRFIIATIKKN